MVACLLGETIVWHGSGSWKAERELAATFAKTLSAGADPTIYEEGQEDELFWTYFERNQPYARGCLYPHRQSLPPSLLKPLAFEIDTSAPRPVLLLESPTSEMNSLQNTVSVIALPTEIFLLVGQNARSRRTDIALALKFAEALAARRKQQADLAHPMPTHCIVFPSVVPRDLSASLRFFRSDSLSAGSASMNVVTAAAAAKELSRTSFPKELLADPSNLPVGVAPENLP